MALMQGSHMLEMAAGEGDAAAEALLAWYDREHRILPWRARPDTRQDPYRVWLSAVSYTHLTLPTIYSV